MRINRYVATSTGMSRRQADNLITEGKVRIDNQVAITGQIVKADQKITLNDKLLKLPTEYITILMHKPKGYVVSRKGQGSKTIYDLLPAEYISLKPVGRLDKESSGLLILSNNGVTIQKLAHPSFNKIKIYEISLDREIQDKDLKTISSGVMLGDGLSNLGIIKVLKNKLTISLQEGRNRQIRRTFKAVGYEVIDLKRVSLGEYRLGSLKPGQYLKINI